MRYALKASLVLAAALAACSGDGVDPGPDPGSPVALSISLASDTLTGLGETTQATATVRDAQGNALSGHDPTWGSGDPNVVVVAQSGLVTSTGTGLTTVTAELGGLTATAAIAVIQRPRQVTITPADRQFTALGQSIQFTAELTDGNGSAIPGMTVRWSTPDSDIVSVTENGLVTALRNGTAGIDVTVGQEVAQISVTVEAPIAFVHANVVPMTTNTVLPDHDVLITDGAISALGPSGSITIPDGAQTIDATGQYLMPGVADMHQHFSCQGGFQCERDMVLNLANGVTVVRSMWGDNYQLGLRNRIAGGDAFGPTIFVASPGVDGPGGGFAAFTPVVNTVAEARDRVKAHAAAGYDFIKVYNNLTDPLYLAIQTEASVQGMRVIGHKPQTVSMDRIMSLGHFTSEHLLDFEQEAASTRSIWSSDPDLAAVRSLAATAAQAQMAVTPTMVVFKTLQAEIPIYRASDGGRYTSQGVFNFSTNTLPAWLVPPSQRAQRLARTRAIIRVLHEEGVPLLLGTDAGVRWVFPGFSIHDELREFVASGLTPYEAILTGTVTAARYLEEVPTFGQVAVGMRADLVLLNANPLIDVDHFDDRVGVLVRGVWTTEAEFRARLEQIARDYGR